MRLQLHEYFSWCFANHADITQASHWLCLHEHTTYFRLELISGKNGRDGVTWLSKDLSYYSPNATLLCSRRIRQRRDVSFAPFLFFCLLNDASSRTEYLNWLRSAP